MEVFFQEQLGTLAGHAGAGRILLVTGANLFERCGAAEILAPILQERGCLRFSDYRPNPTLESLRRLHAVLRSSGRDAFSAILAVGGGTSIDLAKLIKAFANLDEIHPEHLRQEPDDLWDIPLLAVPTTAGSGSEATHFAVIYDGHVKLSVAAPGLRPDFVFLEPALLRSLRAEEAAAGALDAFCQAVESFWSVQASDESRPIAREAALLAWGNMESFVLARDDASMAAMARAAYLAGCAIDQTKTTAAHAVSYPLTSRFGVRHGHAVALVLAALLPFNAQGDAEICQMFGVGDGDADLAAAALLAMVSRIGLSTDLNDLGVVTEADLEFLLDHGFNRERVKNNPRALTREALEAILRPLIRR